MAQGFLLRAYLLVINPIEGEPLWDVVVKFSENFRTIQRVYVVKNLMIEEQKNIENQIPEDEEE